MNFLHSSSLPDGMSALFHKRGFPSSLLLTKSSRKKNPLSMLLPPNSLGRIPGCMPPMTPTKGSATKVISSSPFLFTVMGTPL